MSDQAQPSGELPKRTAEELLRHFEETCGSQLSVDTTTTPLRQALALLEATRDSRASEVVFDINLFGLPLPFTGKESFMPQVSKPEDAKADWRPEVTVFPREALEYFARRAGETANPLCKALYCDFLWSRRDWKQDRMGLLKTAVESYLQASDAAWDMEDKVVGEVTGLAWLRRALDLSLAVKGQDTLVAQSATKAAEFLGRTTVAGGSWTLEFMEYLADNADKIKDHVPSSLILGVVDGMIKDQERNLPDLYDLRCTLLAIAEQWHLTLKENGNAKDWRRRIAQAHVEDAERQEGSSPQGDFRAGLAYEQALTVYMSLGDSANEIAAIKPRMRACHENSKGMYKIVEQDFSVNTAAIGQIIALYSTLSLSQTLTTLSADPHVNPSLAEARVYADACEKAAVFLQFADGAVYRDNLPVQKVCTKEQRVERYTATGFINTLYISADCLLSPIFDGLSSRFPNQRLGIEEQLSHSELFGDLRRTLIRSGLDAYLAGNYIAAVHVLVFQIEGVLRDLIGDLELPTFAFRDGRGQEATLGNVIDTLEMAMERVAGVDENFIALLRYFLQLDGLGPNLRNAVGHGFARPETFSKRNTEILLLILLRLSTFKWSVQTQ